MHCTHTVPLEELKLITCHVGNGVSVTAVDKGISVDTSMGFTPLGGVMMGTRTGDLDPAIIPYLMEHTEDFNKPEDISRILNRESGLLGVSGSSSDMRDIHTAMHNGDEKAKLAYDIFIDRLQKYIGQYLAVLNGADAIIFTAGIGENAVNVRSSIINGISWFGCKVDPEKNVFGVVGDISTDDSRVKVLVMSLQLFRLFKAVCDASTCQIIRTHFNSHTVTDQNKIGRAHV